MADADRRRYLLWRTLGTVLEQLPVALAVHVASAIGWLVALLPTRTRQAAEANLRLIIEQGSDEAADPAVVRRWVRRYYASYARYWAEGATLPAIGLGAVSQQITFVEGADELRAAHAKGKGVILGLPHVGSWEWGGAFLAHVGMPMTAVAERLEPAELFEWFVSKREAIGLHIEPLDDDAGRSILAVLRRGGIVGLLCDRDITGDGIEVELLGQRTRMPAGPATLALRTGATLLAGCVYSGPGDQHQAYVSAPIPTERQGRLRADVQRVSQLLADELGGFIRRSPEAWHVFSALGERASEDGGG